MRQLVVPPYDAAHAERGEKGGHDTGAEDARASTVIPGVVLDGDIVADVVIVPEQQHDHQEEEAEGRDRSIDEHAGWTLHPAIRGCQRVLTGNLPDT